MAEITAESSVDVDADRARVWRALTELDQVNAYSFGAIVETDWQVGSPITWSGEWNGKAFQDKGVILSNIPEQELSYSHFSPLTGQDDVPDNYHVVTLLLSDRDSGTRVTLQQSNLNGGVTDADRASREEYEKNWSTMLAGLKNQVES